MTFEYIPRKSKIHIIINNLIFLHNFFPFFLILLCEYVYPILLGSSNSFIPFFIKNVLANPYLFFFALLDLMLIIIKGNS